VLLYDSPISGNAYKVRLLFAHLGIEYERREVDVVDRSDKREFLAGLNPSRGVPTIVLDDGRPLGESHAILWHFGEGTSFVPEDAYERALVLQWLAFEQHEIEPSIGVARFLITYSGWPRERYESRLKEWWSRAGRALSALDAALDGRELIVGGSPTLADISLYAYTHVAGEGQIDLEPYANVRRWHAGVEALPCHVPMRPERSG
jgi:glutathione S-transferase